jgi:hypothetical protein
MAKILIELIVVQRRPDKQIKGCFKCRREFKVPHDTEKGPIAEF